MIDHFLSDGYISAACCACACSRTAFLPSKSPACGMRCGFFLVSVSDVICKLIFHGCRCIFTTELTGIIEMEDIRAEIIKTNFLTWANIVVLVSLQSTNTNLKNFVFMKEILAWQASDPLTFPHDWESRDSSCKRYLVIKYMSLVDLGGRGRGNKSGAEIIKTEFLTWKNLMHGPLQEHYCTSLNLESFVFIKILAKGTSDPLTILHDWGSRESSCKRYLVIEYLISLSHSGRVCNPVFGSRKSFTDELFCTLFVGLKH